MLNLVGVGCVFMLREKNWTRGGILYGEGVLLQPVHDLPEGAEVAGGKRDRARGDRHQGEESGRENAPEVP